MTSSTNDWPTISGKPPRHHYGIFPWSVLDTTSGVWQRRRKYWDSQGIYGGMGRDGGLLFGGDEHKKINSGTSLFDPVLADIMYKWYGLQDGTVYDPFAGGVTRGAVAAHHGMGYVGVDLSRRQVDANRTQAENLGLSGPRWVHGDGVDKHVVDKYADMVLTCPPYHTLEKYSDNPRDLSAMSWSMHLGALSVASARCYNALRDDRFLVWVTGDLRDKDGYLRGLPHHTRQILMDTGFKPVNEHVLVTPVGTMHRMLRRWWTNTRTSGRRHQTIIVMVKGDRREATKAVNDAYRDKYAVIGGFDEGTYPPGNF